MATWIIYPTADGSEYAQYFVNGSYANVDDDPNTGQPDADSIDSMNDADISGGFEPNWATTLLFQFDSMTPPADWPGAYDSGVVEVYGSVQSHTNDSVEHRCRPRLNGQSATPAAFTTALTNSGGILLDGLQTQSYTSLSGSAVKDFDTGDILYLQHQVFSYTKRQASDNVFYRQHATRIVLTYTPAGGTTPQTVSANHNATASISTVKTGVETVSASHTATATVDTLATHARTLPASHTGTGVLSTIATWARTLADTHTGTAALNTAKLFIETLAATHTGTATLATLQVVGQLLSASHTATASYLRNIGLGAKLATHTAAASLSSVTTKVRQLAANHFGTASLSAVKSFLQSLSATHTGSATLAATQVIGRTLSAAATHTADLVKTVGKSLTATHSGTAVLSTLAEYFRTLGATSVKGATLLTTKTGVAILSAAHTAAASMSQLQVLGVNMLANATHSASLLTEKTTGVIMSAAHTATAAFQRLIGKTLSDSHTGTASLTPVELSATQQLLPASHTATASMTMLVGKQLQASHTGLPAMQRTTSKTLSDAHTGTASVDAGLLSTQQLPALHTMDAVLLTQFIEALVLASTIRKPVNKDIELPSFQAWHTAYRPTFDQLVAIGYAAGAKTLSFGSTVTGLNTVDGRVAFNESFLGFPVELSSSTVYVISSSGSDTGQVRLQGLDSSDVPAEATVALNGTTPVAVPGTWNHIQSVVATDFTNVGTVYCSTDAAALPTTLGDQIQTVMLPGANYSINPMLRTGQNQFALINRFDFSTENRDSFRILIEANREGNWIQNFLLYTRDAQYAQEFRTPIALGPQQKMRVWCEMSGGSNGNASFGFNGFVMQDSIEKRAYKDQAGVDHLFV